MLLISLPLIDQNVCLVGFFALVSEEMILRLEHTEEPASFLCSAVELRLEPSLVLPEFVNKLTQRSDFARGFTLMNVRCIVTRTFMCMLKGRLRIHTQQFTCVDQNVLTVAPFIGELPILDGTPDGGTGYTGRPSGLRLCELRELHVHVHRTLANTSLGWTRRSGK